MPSAPVPGFITKTEATVNYERSHRQLTRDLAEAMKVQNAKVLDYCRLRTEDGQVREGTSITPQLIDELRLDGKNPVWYLRTSWLEKTYGRRGHVHRPSDRPSQFDFASEPEEGSDLSVRPDLVHVLRERIRGLERDKDELRDEMKIKNQQIADRVEREKETNALIRNLQTLMADMQQRLLPPATVRPPEPSIVTPPPAMTAMPPPTPENSRPAIEVEVDHPSAQKTTAKQSRFSPRRKDIKRAESDSKKTTKTNLTPKVKKMATKKVDHTARKSQGFWSRLFS